jgi:lysophospholipase L1-like esterase
MSRRRLPVVTLLLALPLALLLTEIRQYSRNTLADNGRWVSAKPLMQIGLVGAHHFMFTRNALVGNRLDLGAWHGYNEVYFAEPLRLGTLELSFRVEDRAHLSIVFARHPRGFVGMRFSRHPAFPSMLFHGERSGRFTETVPVEGIELGDRWHRARVRAEAGRWVVALDDAVVARSAPEEIPRGFVGLRNGYSRVEIDDLRIVAAGGERLLDEGFRHPWGYWPTLAASLAVAWAALLAVGLPASRRQVESEWVHWVVLVAALATFAALLYWIFDARVWSRSYFYKRHVPSAFQGPATAALVRLETLRQSLLGVDSDRRVEPRPDELTRSLSRWGFSRAFIWPGPHEWHRHVAYSSRAPGRPRYFTRQRLLELGPSDEALRILFVGSSQVVGAGAELLEESLVSRLHRNLVVSMGDRLEARGLALEILNVAVQSSQAPVSLVTFENHWIDLDPDLVLINFSYNDKDLDRFVGGLTRFVELGRERGHSTLFSVEAMAADRDDPFVADKQDAMRELGRRLGAPVIDLEAYMASPPVRDSGFLWWDPVHMSAYAQQVAADWLAVQLEPYLTTLLAD